MRKNNYLNYCVMSGFFFAFLQFFSHEQLFSELNKVTTAKLKNYSQRAYSTFPTILNTYELAKLCQIEAIEGVFIECGVAAGSQIAAMNLAAIEGGQNRIIYLFDSFEGIPLAGVEDELQPGVGKIRHSRDVNNNELLISSNKVYPELKKASCFSVEEVKKNLAEWQMNTSSMIFVKGWFQNTLPKEAKKIEKIALLRLDGDLYESTKVCLEHLYPKVSLGGYVIIDDFALPGCRKAVLEYCEKNGLSPIFQEVIGGLGPVFFKKLI